VSFDDNRRSRQTFDRINRLVSMVLLNTPPPREKRQNERERSEGRLTGQGDTEERKAYVGWSILSLSLSLSLSNARRSISPDQQRNGGIAVAELRARYGNTR